MLAAAVISTVNLVEAAGFLARKGVGQERVRAIQDGISIDRIAFDDKLAIRAGVLEPQTRAAGLRWQTGRALRSPNGWGSTR